MLMEQLTVYPSPQICINCLIFGAFIQCRLVNLCGFNDYGFSDVISGVKVLTNGICFMKLFGVVRNVFSVCSRRERRPNESVLDM